MKPFDAVELYRKWRAGTQTMHQVADEAGVDRATFESVCRLAVDRAWAGRRKACEDLGFCPECHEELPGGVEPCDFCGCVTEGQQPTRA